MSRGRSGGPLSEMEAKAWPALLPHWPVGAGASALAAAGRRVGPRGAPCASPAGACVDWRREIRQVWTASRGLVDPHDRGCCRRLSDTRERPGPLKGSPEGACHATARGGPCQVQPRGRRWGRLVAPTEPLLGLPPERHAAWGTSVGLAVWIIPWALGCSVVSVPGAWHLAQAGAAQGGCWLGERELDKRGALLAGPPPTRTGGLSAGLQDPQGQSARKVRSHQCGSPCDEWTHTGQHRATRPCVTAHAHVARTDAQAAGGRQRAPSRAALCLLLH